MRFEAACPVGLCVDDPRVAHLFGGLLFCRLLCGLLFANRFFDVVVRRDGALVAGVSGRLDPASVPLVAKRIRLKGAHRRDVHVGGDFVFQTGRPEELVAGPLQGSMNVTIRQWIFICSFCFSGSRRIIKTGNSVIWIFIFPGFFIVLRSFNFYYYAAIDRSS